MAPRRQIYKNQNRLRYRRRRTSPRSTLPNTMSETEDGSGTPAAPTAALRPSAGLENAGPAEAAENLPLPAMNDSIWEA